MANEEKFPVNPDQLPSEAKAEYERLSKIIADKDIADKERQELIQRLEKLVLSQIL